MSPPSWRCCHTLSLVGFMATVCASWTSSTGTAHAGPRAEPSAGATCCATACMDRRRAPQGHTRVRRLLVPRRRTSKRHLPGSTLVVEAGASYATRRLSIRSPAARVSGGGGGGSTGAAGGRRRGCGLAALPGLNLALRTGAESAVGAEIRRFLGTCTCMELSPLDSECERSLCSWAPDESEATASVSTARERTRRFRPAGLSPPSTSPSLKRQ
mmetsp:Transcript_26003/g.87153  ORF Transcript_26003/g.87153 Transcript_26003/m.87153 type:complete len:214 (+) Transcript_26003:744-1385(+)